MNSQLIFGDSLRVLKTVPSESVDLIYIDPPFFSNRDYEATDTRGEIASFNDRWAGGINHYIGWLYERVEELYRVLKPTGSFYLHCDWHANAYIRVMILDKIFGDKNFVNEIIWHYKSGGAGNKNFARKHDTIFFYSKTENYKLQLIKEKSYMLPTSGKNPSQKYYSDENGTYTLVNMKDVWFISMLATSCKERIGYPTQKPEALLERIVKASSNPGDIVLDAFCGGGTTMAVARRLGRKFIGIDQSVRAITVSDARLENQNGLANPYEIKWVS